MESVRTTNSGYNSFKGDFLAIHEPIIGKDNSLFKLERVQRVSQKATPLLKGLPLLEKEINSEA